MSNFPNALKSIYSAPLLREINLWAKACLRGKFGDLEFSKIQKSVLEAHFPGFYFNYLTTSTVICDTQMMPVSTDVLCLDVHVALANGYLDVAKYDDMSPVSYFNAGRIISSDRIRPFQEWLNHPFYTKHCKKFDIARSMTLSFQNPERFMTFLAFEYLGTSDNKTWEIISHAQLELATFPFALAWFYRKGLMDEAALDQRFRSMEGLTEAQLTHIRKYVNSPELGFQCQAKDLNISSNWLKESLYNIRDTLAEKNKWDARPAGASQSSLRPLEREYRFFEMLGNPTKTIDLSLIPANPW